MAYTLHTASERQLHEVTPFLQLSKMPGVTVYGPPPTTEYRHTALVSYNVHGADAMDVCHFLDLHGELSCAHPRALTHALSPCRAARLCIHQFPAMSAAEFWFVSCCTHSTCCCSCGAGPPDDDNLTCEVLLDQHGELHLSLSQSFALGAASSAHMV